MSSPFMATPGPRLESMTPSTPGMTPGMTPGPATSSTSNNKPARILACVLCQHRKTKCSRTFPCDNCIKANVTCTPSTPAPARKRRRPNQDLQERLARCEELLKAYASAKPDGPDGTDLTGIDGGPFNGGSKSHGTDEWKPSGKLIVEDDGGVRFVESFMLQTIHQELQAMREIVDGEDNEDATPDTTLATNDDQFEDHTNLLLSDSVDPGSVGEASRAATLEALQPAPNHIFRLWHLYLERVNPLTKVIHVPTLQPYLVEATSGGQNLPQNIKTLLFAIYTMATRSMTPDECVTLLGYSHETALKRFSNGVRLSLMRMGFLQSFDLVTVQALVIYLTSLEGRYNQHAGWVLNGVTMRIAQKMGLHRDGEKLGLNPFETEIRRRVWWQIVILDVKYALRSGLFQSMLPRGWDTEEPKNVNDADLFPTATEPVQDREGPTEMIVVLLTNRLARFVAELPVIEPMVFLADADKLKPSELPSARQVEIFRRVLARGGESLQEIVDKYCDPRAGIVHEMALEVKNKVLAKVEHILLPPREREFNDEVKTMADSVFRTAVQHLVDEVRQQVTVDRVFAWYSQIHFHANMFLFIVGQLVVRTSGKLVDRAWEAVQATYDTYTPLFDLREKAHAQIAMYVLRAWRTRKEVLRERLGGLEPETPDFVLRIRAAMAGQDDPVSGVAIKREPLSAASSMMSSSGTQVSSSMAPESTDNNGAPTVISHMQPNAMHMNGSVNGNVNGNMNGSVNSNGITLGSNNTTQNGDAVTTAAYGSMPLPLQPMMATGAGPSMPGGAGFVNGFAPLPDMQQQQQDDSKMLLSPDPMMDQMLAQTYLDPTMVNWDMWGSITPGAPGFDGFGAPEQW